MRFSPRSRVKLSPLYSTQSILEIRRVHQTGSRSGSGVPDCLVDGPLQHFSATFRWATHGSSLPGEGGTRAGRSGRAAIAAESCGNVVLQPAPCIRPLQTRSDIGPRSALHLVPTRLATCIGAGCGQLEAPIIASGSIGVRFHVPDRDPRRAAGVWLRRRNSTLQPTPGSRPLSSDNNGRPRLAPDVASTEVAAEVLNPRRSFESEVDHVVVETGSVGIFLRELRVLRRCRADQRTPGHQRRGGAGESTFNHLPPSSGKRRGRLAGDGRGSLRKLFAEISARSRHPPS